MYYFKNVEERKRDDKALSLMAGFSPEFLSYERTIQSSATQSHSYTVFTVCNKYFLNNLLMKTQLFVGTLELFLSNCAAFLEEILCVSECLSHM